MTLVGWHTECPDCGRHWVREVRDLIARTHTVTCRDGHVFGVVAVHRTPLSGYAYHLDTKGSRQ